MRSRRQILIRPRLQGKIIAVFLCSSLACLTVQGVLQVVALAKISSELPVDPAAIASKLMSTVLFFSGLSVMLLVPLMTLVGTLVTFRVAGPIYRMESYLRDYLRGETGKPCRIRKDDECQDLCRLINQALAMHQPFADGRPQQVEKCAPVPDEPVAQS